MNSKFIDSSTEMEQFFIDTVNEIKKNINIRRDIKDCKLSDFKKEDKIQLLINILSNDKILTALHGIIFGEKKSPAAI